MRHNRRPTPPERAHNMLTTGTFGWSGKKNKAQRRPRSSSRQPGSRTAAPLSDIIDADSLVAEPEKKSTFKAANRDTHIPSELLGNPTQPQEYDAYFSNNRGRAHHVNTSVKFSETIDPINNALVARFALRTAFARVKNNQHHGNRALARAKEVLIGNFDKIQKDFLLGEDAAEEGRTKRGIQKEPHPIKPVVAAALHYLIESCGFLRGTNNPKRLFKGKEPNGHCGAFFVKKSNGLLRVILDGRHANVYFDPKYCSFQYFRFETLRHVIGNLSKHDTWYALNYDLRHWFHQIPLQTDYARYLGMRLTDPTRRDVPHWWAFPKSLPMGWIMAPYLAQCCTWAILMGGEPDTKWKTDLDVDTDFLDRQRKFGRDTPHTWIPLLKGGGIFVFLDNMLVVTPDKDVADHWRHKIISDCKALHAHLKGGQGHDPDADVETQYETLADCYVTLSRSGENAEKSFDFLGVRWFHSRRQVVISDEEKANPSLPHCSPSGQWIGTRRDMAGVLGKILWYRRVHGIKYFETEHRHETDAILSIYRTLSPDRLSDGSPNNAGWNDPLTESLSPEQLNGLRKAWTTRVTCRGTNAEVHDFRVAPEQIGFAITDAATGKDGDVGKAAGLSYSPAWCKKTLTFLCPELKELHHHKTHDFTNGIAAGEMLAIVETVKDLVAAGKKLIILATDNLACKFWIEKGHARDPQIQQMLDDLHHHLREARLYVTYVNTDDNLADEPSRNAVLVPWKLVNNHELLIRAYDEATSSLWMIDGGSTGGDEVKRK